MSARKRDWTVAELDLHARYREVRALVRPKGCFGGLNCWVNDGPPAVDAHGCLGCGSILGKADDRRGSP